MPTYRVFQLNDGGHVDAPATLIECDSDEQAIEQARQYLDGHAIELWEGKRQIKRFEPQKPRS